jgi:hypothetical protein
MVDGRLEFQPLMSGMEPNLAVGPGNLTSATDSAATWQIPLLSTEYVAERWSFSVKFQFTQAPTSARKNA